MNTKQLIALATIAFATPFAMADDITIVQDHFVAQKSRAEVRVEAAQANAAGLTRLGEAGVAAQTALPASSTLTREQVRAELRASPKLRTLYPEAA